MATNPAYNFGSYDSHGTGAYRYDPQNDAQANGRHRQNFFDNSEQRFMTARFADVTPFLAFDCVPGDRHTFKTNMRLRSYTLASPLMSTLTMSKDYYAVPLSSIIPNTFEKFYANPIKGDDVPEGAYCYMDIPVHSLLTAFRGNVFTKSSGDSLGVSATVPYIATALREFALIREILSSGGLLSSLGYHSDTCFRRYIPYNNAFYNVSRVIPSNRTHVSESPYFQTFDEFFDLNFGTLNSCIIPIAGTPTMVYNYSINSIVVRYRNCPRFTPEYQFVTYDGSPAGIRSFFEDLITIGSYIDMTTGSGSVFALNVSYSESPDSESSLHVVSVNPASSGSDSNFIGTLFPLDRFFGFYSSSDSILCNPRYGFLSSNVFVSPRIYPSDFSFGDYYMWFAAAHEPIDLSYLIAYHQILSQFFTVDAIDNLYTSKLWMENMRSLALDGLSSNVWESYTSFTYNGTTVFYDTFSQNFLANVILSSLNGNTAPARLHSVLNFLANLFCYENSLSYGDYFNGGRLEPLAVGDVNITGTGTSTSDNVTVNALDVTRNLQFQRFLNKVNRTGAAIWDYIRGIQGHIPVQIDPMPRFIAHESCVISGFEVENTTAGDISNPTTQQGYPVTMLNSGESKFAFDIEVGGDPCVVLGLMSFDMRRAYSSTHDRSFFKRDRFDFFQPDLQNIGDQSLLLSELFSVYYSAFDSTTSYAYHLRDTHYKQRYPVAFGGFSRQDILPSWAFVIDFMNYPYVSNGLNSDLIRNHNSDFDKFYQSLNGITLSSYFHFIISIDNQLGSYREMQVKPLIAG